MSTTDAATCATMSDSPRRCLLRGSETADALSFMADRRSAFDARRAGARPSRTPTSIATRNVKKRTRESVPASRIIVPLLALEISAMSACVPQFAKTNPRSPPSADISALSVSNWRIRRERDAPMARRTLIRSEEHTSELQSRLHLVCRLLLEKKKKKKTKYNNNTTHLCYYVVQQ